MAAARQQALLDFIALSDRLKHVDRAARTGARLENSAEHAWHVAMIAVLLAEEWTPRPDIGRVLGMIAVHDVIEIEAGFDPDDPAHPKFPIRFEIDYSRCIFCGFCVEACPEDAIRMVPDVPGLTVTDRSDGMWLGKQELLNWQPARDPAKPYPPRPAKGDGAPSTDTDPPASKQ